MNGKILMIAIIGVVAVAAVGAFVLLSDDAPNEPVSRTVTYDANGGTGTAPAETPKYEGQQFDAKNNTFTYAGKRFIGWNTAADGSGTKYAQGSSITMPSSDITLYAMWEPRLKFSISIAPGIVSDFVASLAPLLPDGWLPDEVALNPNDRGAVSALKLHLKGSVAELDPGIEIYVFNTAKEAADAYAKEKATLNGITLTEGESTYFDQSFTYSVSVGVYKYSHTVFQSGNVYGVIYADAGVLPAAQMLTEFILSNMELFFNST